MNTSCFSMWVVEPGCWDGILDVTRNGYIKMSLGISHCRAVDLGHSPFAVYWFWGSQLAHLKEVSRCRHFTECRIKALAIGSSSSTKHWLNILVNSTTSSFLGSISVATDLRLLKKDFFLVNTTRPDGFHTITHNHTVLHGSTHISLQTEETEKELRPGMTVETGRQKRDVNEAEDLAVLMEGENPEAKAKIVDMISTNYASGGFDDPVVSQGSTWNSKLGPRMGSMIQNLYSDLNSQSEATQAETSDELDTISSDLIRLSQQIKSAEREIAHYSDELDKANKKHEDTASEGGDTSVTFLKKTQIERKLSYWIQKWKNMKNQYELAYQGSSYKSRRLQVYIYRQPKWAEWSPWSKCSVDCGDGGFSVRRRECFTLPHLDCPGAGFDMQPCSTGIKCEAHFHDWGEWGPCSVTCGKGVRARSRVCVTGDRDMKCRGPSTMLEKCTSPKCKPKPVTAAPKVPAPNVAPVLAAPSVAYILSPGIAVGSGVYPVAQPAYEQQPGGQVVAVPEFGASQYQPHSFRAGGAAGFGAVAAGGAAAVAAGAVGAGAVAAGSGGAAKGPLSKVTVVETGSEGGPYVITHHGPENPEEEQTVSPETILFIILFLLCLLLLIIAFCIYFYQRTSDSSAQKKLKDARPFYKQDPGDDDDLDKQPAPGRVKAIMRPGFGYCTELNTPKEPAAPLPPSQPPLFVYPDELMYPAAEEPVFPVGAAPSEQLVGGEGVPWYEDTVPPDQMMLAGQQVAVDEIGQPEQGLALGESSTSEEEGKAKKKKKRKSGQGKALGEKRKSGEGKALGEKRKSGEGKELGEKRKSGEGKELGSKRKSAEGKELGGKRKSAEVKELVVKRQSVEGKELVKRKSLVGTELGGKRKSAEGKELGGKKQSVQEDEFDQSLVAGEKASNDKDPSTPKGDDKKKKSKKGKKGKAKPGSSAPTSDASLSEEVNPEDKSASNIAVDVSEEEEEVDLRLIAQKRQRRTSSRDHSSGDSLWQDDVLPHASPMKRAPNRKEYYLPTLRSLPHFEIPVVEGKHIWARPLDHAQYLENLSSKHKTVFNYSLLIPSSAQVPRDIFSNQEIHKGKGCQRSCLDTEDKLKPYYETKRWSGKIRKLRYRKRSYKRGERKMNAYLKSVFRHKCKNLRYERYKQCQIEAGPEKNREGGDIRSSQKSSRIQNYSESDTYPRDESPVSTNSSYHSNRFPAAKTVNREEEVQWLTNQAKTFQSDIGQGGKPAEMKIFNCKTGDSLNTRKQALSFDHRSRSSLYYRFPSSVYSAQRQRRGKFTSSSYSSSSWLSTLLSESDRKLNEIERDMDAVLKEQCRMRERYTSSIATKGTSGDTLQPSLKGVKNDDMFTTYQPERESAKIYTEVPKPNAEDLSIQGESASKSETKCLEQSESVNSVEPVNSMEPVIIEEPPKCVEDDSIHAYEKKKENILKLLHSTPLYQIRGPLYYAEPWKPLQAKVIGGNHAYQGCHLLSSNLTSEAEHIRAREDTFLTPREHTSFTNGTSLSSQATSAVWTDHDSKGYFKANSYTSSVPPPSTNQQSSTDSSENNMQTTCVSLPFTSYSSLNKMWETERNKFQKAAEVACSLDNENCNPNDDTWRNTQRTVSEEKSEETSERAHQEHVDVTRKPDVHGSIQVHVELQGYPAPGFSAGGDGNHGQHTVQGQGVKRSEGYQMFLNPHVKKDQNRLDRQTGAAPCRRSSNKKDGGRKQTDNMEDTGVRLAAAKGGRSCVEDSTPACSYTDPLTSSRTADSTAVPTSVMYQEHVTPQNNGKRTCDQSGPASTKQSQTGYEQILDKQLEQFMDSTSWISTKDHSKIHIDWNVHKDGKRKMFDEKLQRSKLSQDAHHFEESSISSTVSSSRGLDSGQYLSKSYNQSKPSGSTFHKQAVKEETYQKEFKEDQQCDRYNTVNAGQKQAWRLQEEKLGRIFAQSPYQSCPEVSRTRDKTVSAPHEDKTASMSGEDATVAGSTKWYSACSEVPVSTHYYRTSSGVPSTPDTKRGQADTSNSLASACDFFATPESEMTWETSRTNGSPSKSTYESHFYIRNTSYNSSSSIPCSLNRTFSSDSASSCNNSAVCNTSENVPNLSEYHSLKNTGQLTTSSSRNLHSEDICIFREVISSSESCSDNPVVSDKELLSCLGSLASRMSPTESSYFDLRKPELSNICYSCPDNQGECGISKKKQNMSNRAQVIDLCSDYVCKENSSCDTFSEGDKIIKTSDGKEQEENQVSKEREKKPVRSPFQNHLCRLEMGLEYNKAFTQELDSDSFDDSPDLVVPSPSHKLSLSCSAKELPLQGPFQTGSWSAESLVINDFSGKNDDQDSLTGVQQPGDQLTPVKSFDDFDPRETRIDFLSFVNEADTPGSPYSLKQNAAYDVFGPHLESSRNAETPFSHAYSSDSSLSGDKIHMSKCPEIGTRTGQASKGPIRFDRKHKKEEINIIVDPDMKLCRRAETPSSHSCDSSFKFSEIGALAGQASQDPIHLDKKPGSGEMNSISNDLMAGFCPRTDAVSLYGFRSSSDRNVHAFQNEKCCSPFKEDKKSPNVASSSKHSEGKYKEHFVQESQKTERPASVQTHQKFVDNWNSSAEGGSTMPTCGTEFDFQGFLCKGVKQDDSFTAKFELATVFYRRAIQWSPVFDGRTDDYASDTMSICPSLTLNKSSVMGQTEKASSISERTGASHDVALSWTLNPSTIMGQTQTVSVISERIGASHAVEPSWTLNPSTIMGQTQTASVISEKPGASHDVQPSLTLNPSSARGQAQAVSSISLRLNQSHDVQPKNAPLTSSTTTSKCPSWTAKSSTVRGQTLAASGVSLSLDGSCDLHAQNLCHRTKTYRNQTPTECNHQRPVDSANNCGYTNNCGFSIDFRNTATNKLNESGLSENYNPLEKYNCLQQSNISYTMFAMKREECIGCGDGFTAALDSHDVAAYYTENVDLKATPQATSMLSGTMFRSLSTPKDSLLMESGWMLTAETAAQQSVTNSHEKMFPSKLNIGDTGSSLSSCGSNVKQESSDYMTHEICSVFTTNKALYVDRTETNTAAPDSLRDELHDLGKCSEGTMTQRNVCNMVPDLHLAATDNDIHETDAIPENMVCNRESSFLSSVNVLGDLSPSDNYEHETGSSSLFGGRQLTSGADSHDSLLHGNDPQNLTDPHAWSCSRDFTLPCLQRSSSCSTGFHGGSDYFQRPVSWEATALQNVAYIAECEHCHTKSQKSVLCSSPESIHSSILDASYLFDLSSDQNTDDDTSMHISVSCCGSCENNFHSTKCDSFLPSSSFSVEKHNCSQAIHSYTSADSSDYKKVFSHQENTFSLYSSSDEADLYQPERHDLQSCGCSSKSSLGVVENVSSNSFCSSNERHMSSSSSVPENVCFENFHVFDQSVVSTNSPDSRASEGLSLTKSLRILDESVCSLNEYPSDLSCIDDPLSRSCMPESSTNLGESSVDTAVRSDARSEHYPQTEACCSQELCRRQSSTHLQSENNSSHEEVINHNFATQEPGLMPTASKHYPQVAASSVPKLPIIHISHHLESNLQLDEYSTVAYQNFNTEEPELVLYNCGGQPEVEYASSSQSPVRNNEIASAEPRLMPASSKCYLQIDTSCWRELSERNTSHAECNLYPGDCSEMASQSFNTDEPELVLYNYGRQPEVDPALSSQPLVKE